MYVDDIIIQSLYQAYRWYQQEQHAITLAWSIPYLFSNFSCSISRLSNPYCNPHSKKMMRIFEVETVCQLTPHLLATQRWNNWSTKIPVSSIGSLLYLSVVTRPDISMQSTILLSSLPIQLWNTGQRWSELWDICEEQPILHGIEYVQQSKNKCVGYSDSNWGGDLVYRKSISGYVLQVAGGSISWRRKNKE